MTCQFTRKMIVFTNFTVILISGTISNKNHYANKIHENYTFAVENLLEKTKYKMDHAKAGDDSATQYEN